MIDCQTGGPRAHCRAWPNEDTCSMLRKRTSGNALGHKTVKQAVWQLRFLERLQIVHTMVHNVSKCSLVVTSNSLDLKACTSDIPQAFMPKHMSSVYRKFQETPGVYYFLHCRFRSCLEVSDFLTLSVCVCVFFCSG